MSAVLYTEKKVVSSYRLTATATATRLFILRTSYNLILINFPIVLAVFVNHGSPPVG